VINNYIKGDRVMAQIVSKTGAPVIELGTWVASTGNPAYIALMQEYGDALNRGEAVTTSAFNEMADAFLTATNQEIVGGPM